MRIKFKLKKKNEFLVILNILSQISSPFNTLTEREIEVFAQLLECNKKHENLPINIRDKIIFDYDTRESIAEDLSISKEAVYNIMMRLRKKNIIGKDTIPNMYREGIKIDGSLIIDFIEIDE